MGAPKLTDAERATDRRGLVAARAALHGDTVLMDSCPSCGASNFASGQYDTKACTACGQVFFFVARPAMHVVGLDLPQAPARRTTRVVLDVDWDPSTDDDPTTWSWDLGVDADPGHIRVVTR